MGRIIIKDNSKRFVQVTEEVMDKAMGRMAKDVLTVAKIRVPYKSGQLQESGRVDRKGRMKYRIIFDEDYAALQEKGRRADGSHIVRKYTTPSTSKGFLAEGASTVDKNVINYLRQANKDINL